MSVTTKNMPESSNDSWKWAHPSYMVYISGGTYYAYRTSDGAVTSDADFGRLMNTLNSALSSGGTIFIRDGIYIIASTLTVISNSYINIIGEGNSMIKANNAGDVMLFSVTGSYCTIDNIIFDGNYPANISMDPLLSIQGIGNVVKGCIFQNAYQYCVEFWKSVKGKCINNIFKTCKYGISVSWSAGGSPPGTAIWSSEMLLDGNHFSDCDEVCIKLRGVKGCVVSNNIIDLYAPTFAPSVNTDGIDCYHGDTSPCVDVVISNNFIWDSAGTGTGVGIAVTNDSLNVARRIKIIDNIINGCGIAISVAWKDVEIRGNTVFGRASAIGGIRTTADRTTIVDNKLYASGIEVFDGADQCLVERNFVTGGVQYYKVGGAGIAVWSEPATLACNATIIRGNQIDTVTGDGIVLWVEAGWVNPTNTLVELNVITTVGGVYIHDHGTGTITGAGNRKENNAAI